MEEIIVIGGFSELISVKNLRVLAIQNPSIRAERDYCLSCELGIVLPASQGCYRSQLMEKGTNVIIIRSPVSFYYL